MNNFFRFLLLFCIAVGFLVACDNGGDDDDDNNNDTDDDAYYDCDDVSLELLGDSIFFEPLKCDGEEMFFTTPEEEPYNSNYATVLRSQEDLDAILDDFNVSCQVDFEKYMVPIIWTVNDWERKLCGAVENELDGKPRILMIGVELELKDQSLPPEKKRSIHFGKIKITDRRVDFTFYSWGDDDDL